MGIATNRWIFRTGRPPRFGWPREENTMTDTLSRYGGLCLVALALGAYPSGVAGAGERQDVGTQAQGGWALEEKIVFTDTCDDPVGDVIMMNPDGTGRFNLTRAFGVS